MHGGNTRQIWPTGQPERIQTRSRRNLTHRCGRHLSIPDHKELDRGTLRALIRGAGIIVEEFVGLLLNENQMQTALVTLFVRNPFAPNGSQKIDEKLTLTENEKTS